MNGSVRVFVSYASQDTKYRDLLVGKVRHASLPYDFVEMIHKAPGDTMWESQCRGKMKASAGVIVFVSAHTAYAPSVLREVKIARDEGVPLCGIYVEFVRRPLHLVSELQGIRIIEWKWREISAYLNSLVASSPAASFEPTRSLPDQLELSG